MPFQPQVNDQLVINGATYRIAEHPAAPGMPYGQAGRRAIVYQVTTGGGEHDALKVFSRRFRTPALVPVAQKLAPYATLPGLQVCRREVLTPQRNGPLLRQHPDLTYAVLMPWIEGATWMETMARRDDPSQSPLTPAESMALAHSLAKVLAAMEEKGLAHCDLSGPNVLLPPAGGVALVDVEEMYGSEFERPAVLSGGSGGYAHQSVKNGVWKATGDRFAGAVLLAEMLGWCDARVREATWGEQYFDGAEVQQESTRYRLLIEVLQERWGKRVAELFARAWQSSTLEACPAFAVWLAVLSGDADGAVPVVEDVRAEIDETQVQAPEPDWEVVGGDSASGGEEGALESTARSLYEALQGQIAQGNWEEAERLGQALAVLWPGYRDLPALLKQVSGGREEEQKVAQEIAHWEQAFQEPEARLAEARDALAAERRQLEQQLQALDARDEELRQRGNSLAEARQALEEARRLLARHRWEEARQWLGGLAEVVSQGHPTASSARVSGGITEKQVRRLKEVRRLKHVTRGLLGHSDTYRVSSVAFFPRPTDATQVLLASASEGGRIWLWRRDGTLLRTLTGPAGWIHSVAFSPDGATLASGASDGTVRLWRVADGALLRTSKGHTGRVWSVAFSPDGTTLASGSGDTTVRLWRVADGAPVRTLHKIEVRSVAFSPDGTTLASGSGDGTVRLWRAADGTLLHTLKEHAGRVMGVAFSPDGTLLASGAEDGIVQSWRVTDGMPLLTLKGHTGGVRSVAFSPDGTTLASGAKDKTVRVWRVADGTLLHALLGHTDVVRSVAFSPDGTLLASGSWDATVRLWG